MLYNVFKYPIPIVIRYETTIIVYNVSRKENENKTGFTFEIEYYKTFTMVKRKLRD